MLLHPHTYLHLLHSHPPLSNPRPVRPLLDTHNPHLRPLPFFLPRRIYHVVPFRLRHRGIRLRLEAPLYRRVARIFIWAGASHLAVACAKVPGRG